MHDKKQLQAQREIRDDEQKLIQSAQLAARELEQLFESDAEPAPAAGAPRRELADGLDRARVGGVHEAFDGLLGARREQQAQHHFVGRARRIVDQDLLDEPRHAMLHFVDEAQLVADRSADRRPRRR